MVKLKSIFNKLLSFFKLKTDTIDDMYQPLPLEINGHTQTYKILKDKIQEIFDFAATSCQAFPVLKNAIDNNQPLPRPDYFGGNNTPLLLKGQINSYEQKLSTYLFLVSFSYFENYIKNVIIEIVNIHNNNLMTKDQTKASVSNSNHKKLKLKLKQEEGGVTEQQAQDYKKYELAFKTLSDTDSSNASQKQAKKTLRWYDKKYPNS